MRHSDPAIQYLLDLEAIKKLKYQYCRDNDGGWPAQPVSHQGPSADLFTDDAVWDGRPLAIAEGREEIRKLFASFADLFKIAYHAVTNPIIEVNGDTATGHWHVMNGGLAHGNAMFSLNGYEDEYVRTSAGWRFRRVRVNLGPRTHIVDKWEGAIPKTE